MIVPRLYADKKIVFKSARGDYLHRANHFSRIVSWVSPQEFEVICLPPPKTIAGLTEGVTYSVINATKRHMVKAPSDYSTYRGGLTYVYAATFSPGTTDSDWLIEKASETTVRIRSCANGYYLVSTGEKPTRNEGGWLRSPNMILVKDPLVPERAEFIIRRTGTQHYFENVYTKRWVFSYGGGFTAQEPLEKTKVIGTDQMYYSLWRWTFTPTNKISQCAY